MASLPSAFSVGKGKGKGKAAAPTSNSTKLFTYERDIICLPSTFENNGNVRIPKGVAREYLGRNGLIGKVVINSSMNQNEIYDEIRSIFRAAMSYKKNFKLLQPIGGSGKSLIIPAISSSYRWTASVVAGKNAKMPVYILAVDQLMV